MRTARNMNQPLIGAPQWGQPVHLCNHMGILRYQRSSGTVYPSGRQAACIAARQIHMGVWRDPSQPRNEETGALG
ncbi:hypothetical protein GGD70_008183 [Paraburkholderia fungorum]|nr:hypothetical protein [Paraburkholderia fungorum]